MWPLVIVLVVGVVPRADADTIPCDNDDDPAAIALSATMPVRFPLGRDMWTLSYTSWMWGLGAELALPRNKVGGGAETRCVSAADERERKASYLFLHMAADANCTEDGNFCGVRVAPIGFGYWMGCGESCEYGLVVNAHVEYMRGRAQIDFPTQSSLALGGGGQFYIGWLPDSEGHVEIGVAVGMEMRGMSFQDAGVAMGFGADFLVRPMIGVQGF